MIEIIIKFRNGKWQFYLQSVEDRKYFILKTDLTGWLNLDDFDFLKQYRIDK